MRAIGYSAFEAKKSGIMIAWPMPISRSRLSTIPAMDIDRHEKNAVASQHRERPAPRSRQGPSAGRHAEHGGHHEDDDLR